MGKDEGARLGQHQLRKAQLSGHHLLCCSKAEEKIGKLG